MTNNDILRRLRFTFDIDDAGVINIFKLAEVDVTREQISAWLKKDDDDDYVYCDDVDFASFLNGFINLKRGKKDAKQPAPEKKLTHNMRFMKLKIALNLKAEDIIDILALADFRLSKHELSAFFRKAGHKHFRACQDQVIRNFLQGLQKKFRPESLTTPAPVEKPAEKVREETDSDTGNAISSKPTAPDSPYKKKAK